MQISIKSITTLKILVVVFSAMIFITIVHSFVINSYREKCSHLLPHEDDMRWGEVVGEWDLNSIPYLFMYPSDYNKYINMLDCYGIPKVTIETLDPSVKNRFIQIRKLYPGLHSEVYKSDVVGGIIYCGIINESPGSEAIVFVILLI